MALVESVLDRTPEPLRSQAIKHRELLKFAVVGGVCWLITVVLWWIGKMTVLSTKPVTAQAVAIIIATIISYLLSREWSFRTRGGRERHHEATLFFLVAGVAVVINLLPTLASRYLLGFQVPNVSKFDQELADFIFGAVLGTVFATAFRFWALKKFVFPQQGVRARRGNVSALRPEDSVHVTTEDVA